MGSVWLTDLADACRSTGLRVIEEPGWRTRGHGGLATRPQGILCHHTAASAKSYAENPYPSLRTVRDGRPDLDGPLSQLGLQRDLAVRVIAAGRCWHAGATAASWQNNDHALGIEAEHDGVSEWPDDLYAAYVQLVAGLRKWYAVQLERVAGHKEAAVPKGRKTDPNFPMPSFRTAVGSYRPDTGNEEVDDLTPAQAAQLDRVEKGLQALALAETNRYADEVRRIQALTSQEAGRYADYVRRYNEIMQELADDPASPITAAHLLDADALPAADGD